MDFRRDVRLGFVTAGLIATLLTLPSIAGCAFPFGVSRSTPAVYQQERFETDETFSRLFDTNVKDTCETARRALLSQGYIITTSRSESIVGSKRFRPEGEVHIEIKFTVVCVLERADGSIATAYVSAQQDRYVLKKIPNNTSLGVGVLGSISVPLSSSGDSLVKVGSETLPAGQFYDRYFALMQRLVADIR